jgi:hypothetical protein
VQAHTLWCPILCGQSVAVILIKSESLLLKTMDRRSFLSASLTASVLSAAGTAAAGAQSPVSSSVAGAEYYALRRYQLISGPGTRLTDNYFTGALIPALNRLGIGPVGAFSIYFGPDTPAYYLLLPSTKLETLVTAELELANDPVFMKAAAPFWDAPGGAPPYSRIESTLLRAFEGYPKLVAPPAAAKKEKRIYHLRQYVSPTNMDHVRKVEMFHQGEFGIFAKAGAAGRVLCGCADRTEIAESDVHAQLPGCRGTRSRLG